MKLKVLVCIGVGLFILSCSPKNKTLLISYVDPSIGTSISGSPSAGSNNNEPANFGQTIPAVTAPFGMTQWTPQNMEIENKSASPFYAGKNRINGFRASHWMSGSTAQDYGSFTLMPVSTKQGHLPRIRQSEFFLDFDNLSPAYSATHIPFHNVITEITATKRCGFFRFSWLNAETTSIIFDVNSHEGEGFIRFDAERNEVAAANPVHRIYSGEGQPAGFSGYMVARFDCEISGFNTFAGQEVFENQTEISNRPNLGAIIHLKSGPGDIINVKIGTSFTSIENARENLDSEIPGWDFDVVRLELEKTWEKLLGQIIVEEGTEDALTKFYTAIYHSCQQPRLFSDADGSYPGFAGDTAVHTAHGFDFYTDFLAGETYHAQMPLVSLIAPKVYEDMVKSLIEQSEQGDWLPASPMWNSYTTSGTGDHVSAIIGDAFMKGFSFDEEKAWKYMRKNAFEIPADYEAYAIGKGRRALRTYMDYGYIPLEDEVPDAHQPRGQVSRTLDYAYNDWVLAQVADKLGHKADNKELMERARNYTNVYDQEKGWVCGKFVDGNFTSEFDAGQPMPYIINGTPKQLTWSVPQDVNGLIELMGGKDIFLQKLESIFNNRDYSQLNAACHHMPYLFNFAERWDLTQKTVKNILKTEYSPGHGGLPGNDKSGQLSAWYVFSAMGFYPVCVGSNEYQLSSPAFSKVTLNLDKNYYPGRKSVFQTRSTKPVEIFTTVTLDGKKTGTTLNHSTLKKGGKLLFSAD